MSESKEAKVEDPISEPAIISKVDPIVEVVETKTQDPPLEVVPPTTEVISEPTDTQAQKVIPEVQSVEIEAPVPVPSENTEEPLTVSPETEINAPSPKSPEVQTSEVSVVPTSAITGTPVSEPLVAAPEPETKSAPAPISPAIKAIEPVVAVPEIEPSVPISTPSENPTSEIISPTPDVPASELALSSPSIEANEPISVSPESQTSTLVSTSSETQFIDKMLESTDIHLMSESPQSQLNDPIFDKDADDSEEHSSGETNTTPNSELSPPDSPAAKSRDLLLPVDKKANARNLAASLSLEEQVSLLTAADFWRSQSIPEKGIPAFKTSDGPNGARGAIFKAGTKAALFPCGVSLAATWNTNLLYQVGQHLGDEAKARSAHVLLAPTVCLHRGPLGGRNFESFSEDPYLTGKLAASYIRGLQGKGVAATIKHFVGNEQETQRFKINSTIEERPLRELYLRPFEIAIREANPWALMSSYNLVNGIHADMNEHTLKKILREEWQYEGTVMSDWGGTNSTIESIEAGCDIEMPVGKDRRCAHALKAVAEGTLSKEAIEKAAASVLYLVERTRHGDMSAELPEREDDREETRHLIRSAGAEGLTLLKNEGNILPIKPSETKIAVIGPNANRAIAGGGGSASLNPYYYTLPLDSIKAVPGKEVTYAVGCHTHKWLPLAAPFCTTAAGLPGVDLEFFIGDKFQGIPKVLQRRTNTDLFMWDSVPQEVAGVWSCRARTFLTPTTSGLHTLSFSTVGAGRLFVDRKLTVDAWNWTEAGEAMFGDSQQALVTLQLEAGKPIELMSEMTNEVRPLWRQKTDKKTHEYGGIRIGYKEEDKKDYLQEAIDIAKAADVAVVIVGLDGEWESEGYDRSTMDLPSNGSQDRLVEAVLAANPRTIVVNQSGSPVTMPWADRVPTILQGWYQGQEAGNALADVLFGLKNPSGKLPTTFPRRLEDNPTLHNWPGENLKVVYGEGLYIGYRHYERSKIAPLFPFGHGLSYTSFSYGKPIISAATLSENDKITITVPITNSGEVEGAEIVQAYIHDVRSRLPRPEKELQAFDKVFLKPGETKDATLFLDKYSVGYYDTDFPAWIAEEGVFEVLIGASSVDIREKTSFEVTKSFTWVV